MTSLILRSPTLMTAPARPRLERDPALGLENWKWCFDFTRADGNPAADGVVANGVALTNFARGYAGNPGYIRNPGGTIIQAVGRAGLVFGPGTENVTDFVEIGGNSVDFSGTNNDFLAILWDKQPLAGYNTATYRPILWDSTGSANPASLWIDSGNNGRTIRGVLGTGAASAAANTASGLGQGAPRQIAFARQGTAMTVWINGVQAGSYGAGPATLQTTTAALTKLAGNHTATLYRTLGCALGGAYDRTPAEIVALDWAAFQSKYS